MDYLEQTAPHVWEEAKRLVAQFNSSLSNFTSSERMENAIVFLRTLAEKQRAGEMAFIKNKINELKTRDSIPTKDIKKLEKRQEKLIRAIENDEGFDYEEFVGLLNEVTVLKEALVGRIETLQNNIAANQGNAKQINGLLEDIGEEIENVMALLKERKEENNKAKKSYINIMPIILTDFMEKNKGSLAGLDPKELTSWVAQVTIKFRQYLEKTQGLHGFTSVPDFDTRKKILEEKFEQFLKRDNVFIISQNDKKLLDEISVQFFKSDITEKDLNRKYYEAINPFSGVPTTPEILFNFDLFDYSVSEKVSQILYRLGNNFRSSGAANMADDALIGTLSADIKIEYFDQLNKAIDNTLDALAKEAKDFADVRTNREQYYKNLTTLNQNIENILKKLNKELQEKGETGFIIHESDKYYQSIEHGKTGSRPGEFGFHGRTMSIMNYIDTMASISYDFGITDPDLWKFVGINLSRHTVAEGCASPMEEIFTLAAGLIMFDDFSAIVKEGMELLDFSNLYNIHLYKLQSLYFPASYILKETADYLEFCLGENPAKAVITVPFNIYEINNYADLNRLYGIKNKSSKSWQQMEQRRNKYLNANTSTDEKWEMVKDYLATETKVSINFFLNFQNFISRIPH